MRFSSLALPMTLAAPLLVSLSSCVGPAPRAPDPAPASASRPRPAPHRSAPHRSASQSPAPQSPAPIGPTAPAPAPFATEWQYRPATPGNWTYRADGAGSVALFGPTGGEALFSIRCDRAGGRIRFERAGVGQGAMIVRTSTGAASWPLAPAVGAATVAIRAANDAMLDQIAYSRGRFMVEIAGLAPLYLPAWGEVAHVIEDCRG